MRAFLHYEQRAAHQLEAMRAMAAGLATHGVHCDVSDGWHGSPLADFVVCWGDKVPHIWNGPPQLLLEAGYINGRSGDYVRDRLQYVSAGWNGLHGRADPGPLDRPPDRWEALGVSMLPWRDSGDYWLICDQHPGDAQSPPLKEWWRGATSLAQDAGLPAIYRPHPLLAPDTRPLRLALLAAARCITWSSTCAIEAVMLGVPTVALSEGSMAWPVTSHHLSDDPFLSSRAQWGYNLAYQQWRHTELADGTAWEHLKEGL